jgi:PilZ domain
MRKTRLLKIETKGVDRMCQSTPFRNGPFARGQDLSKPRQPPNALPEWGFRGVHPLGLMPTATGTTLAPIPVHRKSAARVALFDLPDTSAQLMTDCFRQSGIETVCIPRAQADRLQREKFEACVLALEETAGSIIELARGSASNNRIIIYGLGGSAQDSMRYSKLCLNAVFHEPLERSAAMKLVRSTRMLVLHEFRRYVRVPVMTEVGIVLADGGRMTATSQEISSGGMSLKANQSPELDSLIEVSFSLLTLPRVWVRGHVTWRKPNKTFGVRFDPADERRRRLKEWIVGYLEG